MTALLFVTFLFSLAAAIVVGLTIHKHGVGHTIRLACAWGWGLSYRYEYMAHHWRESAAVHRKWVAAKMATEVEG